MVSIHQLAAELQRLNYEAQRLTQENAALRDLKAKRFGFAQGVAGEKQRRYGFMSPDNLKRRFDFMG